MSFFKKLGRFIKNHFNDLKGFLWVWKPKYFWLFQNRHLRMDANAPINDKDRRDFHKARYDFVVQLFKNKDCSSWFVLDAACGTGYGSDMIKALKPSSIIGLDIGKDAVEYANAVYGEDNCRFIQDDVTRMTEIAGQSFDLVVSFETIEHIKEPLIFLQKIASVLKEDGRLVISTPNSWGETKDHEYDYDYALLRDHLQRYFVIDEMYVQNSGCMNLWVNRNQARRLVLATDDNLDTAECYIAVCRKK